MREVLLRLLGVSVAASVVLAVGCTSTKHLPAQRTVLGLEDGTSAMKREAAPGMLAPNADEMERREANPYRIEGPVIIQRERPVYVAPYSSPVIPPRPELQSPAYPYDEPRFYSHRPYYTRNYDSYSGAPTMDRHHYYQDHSGGPIYFPSR